MAITKKDIEKLSEIFVTKTEFRQELFDGLNSVRSELKDQILSSEDKVIKKIEDMIIEQKNG